MTPIRARYTNHFLMKVENFRLIERSNQHIQTLYFCP